MRAPIFYDSANTAYYVDPGANSYLYGSTYGGLSIGEAPTNYDGWDRQLTVHGSGHSRITSKTATRRMGIHAHDSWHNSGGGYVGTYTNHNLTFIQNAASAGYIDTSKNLQWTGGGTLRSPLFYDSNDTSYYFDGGSATDSLVARGTIHIGPEGHLGLGDLSHPKIAYPGEGAAWSGSGTTTGQVVIDLPGNLSNYDMMYLEIDVFEYNGLGGSKIIIGGHNWNSGGEGTTTSTMWHNNDVRIVGRFNKDIFLGWRNDGTNNRRVIVLGSPTSSWSYGTVHVAKVSGATDFYNNSIDYTGNWNVTQSTSSSYYTKNPTTNWNDSDSRTMRVHRTASANRVYGDADIRSPIFYDNNDTAFYTNPAATSIFSTVKTIALAPKVRNNNSGQGMYNTATGQHFWSDDDDFWNIGGGGSANGLRFRDEHNGTIRGYVYANNSNDIGFLDEAAGWALRVVAGNYTTSVGSMRAPIFYDSDNTGYYTDPASNSHLNTLSTAGQLTVGNTTSSDIYMTDTDEGTRRIHCNSNRIGFLNSSSNWGSYCTDNGDWKTDTISYAGASSRAPIFYDSNNTAYYTDQASTLDYEYNSHHRVGVN